MRKGNKEEKVSMTSIVPLNTQWINLKEKNYKYYDVR